MEPTEWSIGVHRLSFEPPDICHCYLNGPVAIDEAIRAFEVIEEEIVPRVGNNFYYVTHLSANSKGTPPATRKYISSVKPKWKASIIVGGTAVSRTAVNMVMRTANLLAGVSAPLRMVSNDDEAYALISEWRAAGKPG